MPVHDKVKKYAEKQGLKTAINIEGKTLNWQQLWQCALSIYQAVIDSLPINEEAPQKIIAVALGNDLQFAPAWLAATANTFTCAVIDPDLPHAHLLDVFGRLTPDLLLVKKTQQPLIELAKKLHISILIVDDISAQADKVNLENQQEFISHVDAPTPFLINFTSGTTSTPKAFSRSRHSWRVSFKNGRKIFDLDAVDSTLFPGPLFHGIGLYCLNEALDAGTTFYCLHKWDAARALDLLNQHKIQRLVLVPTMLSAFAKLIAATTPTVMNSVTHLLSAGAKLELNHYKQAAAIFPKAGIQEYYGASELGFIAVSTFDRQNLINPQNVESQLTTVGLPFPEVSWTIRDEDGNPLSDGSPGIIYLHSEQACSGYLWGDDGKAFSHDELGSTVRDMGYIDPLGRLVVIGRSGDMIISGGNNIYPAEVESAIKSLPGIIEAVVFAVDDDYRGKKLIAFIESETLDIQQLPVLCLAKLAKYKIPAHFYQVHDWPLTPSGKIKRPVLKQRLINHEIK